MKFKLPENWLAGIFADRHKSEKVKLLRQQRALLHSGLETTAEVMQTSLHQDPVGNMLPVWLWLKLKKSDGSFIYIQTGSLVSLKHIPVKGEILRIKYLPDDLSAILIL
jgi:hypothetical protein